MKTPSPNKNTMNNKLQHLLDSHQIKAYEETADDNLILIFPDGTVLTIGGVSLSGESATLFIE